MEDLFKKFLYTGVGLVSSTAEKMQSNINELVDKTKASEEEGRKLVDDLVKDTENKRSEIEAKIKANIDAAFAKLNMPTQEELISLREKVAELEAKLAEQTVPVGIEVTAPEEKGSKAKAK